MERVDLPRGKESNRHEIIRPQAWLGDNSKAWHAREALYECTQTHNTQNRD